jgi:hypothetical protein
VAAKPESTIATKFREGWPIDRALVKAVREALVVHKRLGHPIATWRDGEVVWIPPEQIPDPPLEQ